MRRFAGLACSLLILLGTIFSSTLVLCQAGPDHRELEWIGHALVISDAGNAERSVCHSCCHAHHHAVPAKDEHPDDCADSELLADAIPVRAVIGDLGPAPMLGVLHWVGSHEDLIVISSGSIELLPRPPPDAPDDVLRRLRSVILLI